MKALIYDGTRVIYENAHHDEPEDYPRRLKIKITLAGICSTDLSIIDGKYYNKALLKANGVLGHEGCGYVAQSLPDSSFKVGDHVVFETVFPCRKCEMCSQGLTNYCQSWKHIGINSNGSFAEYLTVDESMVHRVSKDIPPAISVLAEPLSIALNSIVSVFSGCSNEAQRVAVVGPGILGLLHTLLLAKNGHYVDVFGVAGDVRRLEKARYLGANNIFENTVAKTRPAYDLVIDTSNTHSGASFALELCKPGGHLRTLNLSTGKAISSSDIVRRGCHISTSKGIQHRHMVAACAYMEANGHELNGLATHTFSLDEHQRAFDFVRRHEGIKSVFNFN